MKNNVIIINILLCFLLSCRSSQKENEVKQIVETWQGREINVPTNVRYTIFGHDTICSDIWNKPYKILVYLDSVGCTACRFDQKQWKKIIISCDSLQQSIGFIFIIHSSDYEMFESDLIAKNFYYPVIYDFTNDFFKENHFPQPPYNTFLIDKYNKVLLTGSPINNPKMWELYKKTITQSK